MTSQQDVTTIKTENVSDSTQTILPSITLTNLCVDGKFNELKKKIQEGENILETDTEGNYLTHTAARHGKLEILQWLVTNKQMNVNEVNHSNKPVLRVAFESKQLPIIKWLIENPRESKVEITVEDLGEGVKLGNLEIVQKIVETVDICQEIAQGKTPIELAHDENKTDIETFLSEQVFLKILDNQKIEKEKLDSLKRYLGTQNVDFFNRKIKYKGNRLAIVEIAKEKQFMDIVKWIEGKRTDINVEVTSDQTETKKLKEYNVLIVGETGVGKSTFINALVNYINFNSLDEAEQSSDIYCLIPTSFAITDENYDRHTITFGQNQDANESFASGESSTQSAKSYSIKTETATVRLIDTPGIGDTRGIEKDQENFDKLLKVIAELEDIHAICIMLKPNNARLSVLFEYCIKGIFANLDRSASQNIVFLFTNSRATFYRPGDTLPPLLKVLDELEGEPTNVKIPFNKNNVFCVDNEAFRFLLARKQSVTFTKDEKDDFSGSWDKSSQVCRSLIEYLVKLKPHKIQSTISINAAKRLVLSLSRPLADVAQHISKTAVYLQGKKDEFEHNKGNIEELKKHLHFEVLVPKPKRLEKPVTMCQHKECTKLHKLSSYDVHSEYRICHDECSLEKIVPDVKGHKSLRNCTKMRLNCLICKHSFIDHIHCYYVTELVKETIKNLKAEFDIKNLEKMNIESLICQMQELYDKYKTQEEIILRSMSKFSHFLKRNSIIVFNDICKNNIQNLIDEERKLDTLTNTNRLNIYQDMLGKYEGYYAELEEKFKQTGKAVVTPSEIFDEMNKLYELEINGENIRKIADAQMEQQKKETLPDIQVVPKSNTFANFLKSIK